ncbi:hypothetical protein DU000_05605 [Parvibium lacunae]|uniref:Uncharacterized protein n=2 Tax=Parvibium lacunae TaxID=1888893 RepID=A0A368L3Z4_9BURK|nr:hypothetical protein DU000_05605 [Parvibium lacunae]
MHNCSKQKTRKAVCAKRVMGDVACHLALAEFIMRPQAELKSARLWGDYGGERGGRQMSI